MGFLKRGLKAGSKPESKLARAWSGGEIHVPDWRILLFWVLVAALIGQSIAGSANFLDGRVWDWGHFFYAAEALTEGRSPFEAGESGYIYPVVFAWLIQPATYLDLASSAVIWTVMMGVALAGSLVLVRKALEQAGAPGPTAALAAAIGAILVADKFVSTLKSAQTDGLILMACLAALVFIRRRPILAGLLIAGAAALKYHALLFVILFVFRHRWRAAAAAVVGFLGLLALPASSLGWATNMEYTAQAFAGVWGMIMDLPLIRSEPSAGGGAALAPITWDRSVSATSAAMRLANQLPDAVSFAGPALLLIATVLAGVVAARGYARNNLRPFGPLSNPTRKTVTAADLCDWALVLTVMVVLSPQSTGRHFVYLLLPLAMIALTALRAANPEVRRFFALGAFGFLLALSMPLSEYPDLMNAWRALSFASWVMMALVAALPLNFLRLDPALSLAETR